MVCECEENDCILQLNHNNFKGPSIKDVRKKSRRIDSSFLVRKMSALAQPPPPCPSGHTINFEKSGAFCTKTCGRPNLKNPSPIVRKMSELDNLPPPLTAESFMDSPYNSCNSNSKIVWNNAEWQCKDAKEVKEKTLWLI